MVRRVRHLLVCLVLLLLLPASAQAAPHRQDAALSLFLTLFPELRVLPAPNWVEPGVRVTYADASASIAQVEDQQGSGGAGLTQYDVVARDRRVVPIAARLYLDLGDGRYQANLGFGLIAPGGAGEFWVSPLAFRRADELEVEGLQVNRIDYEVAGATFDAIRFDYETEESVSAWVFDLESGLLLFSRSSVEGGTHRLQSNRTLVGVRTLDLPWSAGRAPRSLVAGESLRYSGTSTAFIGGDPIALPIESTVQVEEAHSRWTFSTSTVVLQGLAQAPNTNITGGLQIFGGVWLPTSALNADPPRARIDRDPYTGAQITYEKAGDFVTLTESGGGYETVMVYDARGILVLLRNTREVGVAITTDELQLVE